MSFDPEKVQPWDARDEHVSGDGEFVLYDDYAQLMTLLHDVSTDADPAGTVRENRMLQDKVAAQEVLIQELRAEMKKLKEERKWGQ